MIELLETYSKATDVVKNYYMDKFLETLEKEDLPKEFKEHVRTQGIENDRLAKILGENPRSLFDVFDERDIFIIIDGGGNKWFWKIDGLTGSTYKKRKEAELSAIVEAFKLLEEKI